MSDVEVKREETLTREKAAQQLAALATALADSEDVELALGASTVKVHVPDQVRCEIEIEVDNDEVELEVELKWTTGGRTSDGQASGGQAPSTDTALSGHGKARGRKARTTKR